MQIDDDGIKSNLCTRKKCVFGYLIAIYIRIAVIIIYSPECNKAVVFIVGLQIFAIT